LKNTSEKSVMMIDWNDEIQKKKTPHSPSRLMLRVGSLYHRVAKLDNLKPCVVFAHRLPVVQAFDYTLIGVPSQGVAMDAKDGASLLDVVSPCRYDRIEIAGHHMPILL
jgi:hypothetical protein